MRSSLNVSFYDPVSLSYQGGGERWILEVANRLLARGHEVNVFTTGWIPSGSSGKKVVSKGIVDVVEMKYVRFFKGFAVPSALDLSMLARAFDDSDVVYFYVCPPNELMAWALRHKIHRPLVGGFHAFLQPDRYLLHQVYLPLFKKALSTFDCLHVLNRSTAQLMDRWGYTNTYFIPNGVDTNVFRLGDSSMKDGVFNVLYTGRLTKDKGADVLSEIIRYVNEELRIRNIKFTICGFGPLKNLIIKTTHKYENVKYLGFVPPEIIASIYREAQLFLSPSRTESMPLSLLEAQSCGLPVVGSKIPGILEIIRNNTNGVLVDVDDIKGFSNALKRYYELWCASKEEYHALDKAIRENMVKHYDWNVIICKIEEMLRKCTKESNRLNK
jgi:glycosyltransferase involved in cell wall biosynthesis